MGGHAWRERLSIYIFCFLVAHSFPFLTIITIATTVKHACSLLENNNIKKRQIQFTNNTQPNHIYIAIDTHISYTHTHTMMPRSWTATTVAAAALFVSTVSTPTHAVNMFDDEAKQAQKPMRTLFETEGSDEVPHIPAESRIVGGQNAYPGEYPSFGTYLILRQG